MRFSWPWDKKINELLTKVDTVLQGLIDLQAAVASVQTMEAAVIAELQALQAATGDSDATVESLTQQINTSVANINAAIPQPAPTAGAGGSAQSAAPAAQPVGS